MAIRLSASNGEKNRPKSGFSLYFSLLWQDLGLETGSPKTAYPAIQDSNWKAVEKAAESEACIACDDAGQAAAQMNAAFSPEEIPRIGPKLVPKND